MALPKTATEQVVCLSSTVATYSASFTGAAPAALATDIINIQNAGSTKVLKILRVEITGVATAAATVDLLLVKRSTPNTGGVQLSLTAVPADSRNAAATASVISYSTLPTIGTLVGSVRASKLFLSTAAATVADPSLIWDFGSRPGQAIALYPGENLAINNNGQVVGAGTLLNGSIEWTEE
jgi:hypothetical protein